MDALCPLRGDQGDLCHSRLSRANAIQTEVVHTDHYRHANGRSIRKEWKYNIEEHSQAVGFEHHASESIRGFALDNGSATWLIPMLQTNQFAPFELFVKRDKIRHSFGVPHGKDGELMRNASMREKRGSQQGKGWSGSVIQVEPWNPVGR